MAPDASEKHDDKRPDVDPAREPTPEEEAKRPVEDVNDVSEAGYESFPASDPPSYSRGTATKKDEED